MHIKLKTLISKILRQTEKHFKHNIFILQKKATTLAACVNHTLDNKAEKCLQYLRRKQENFFILT